MIKFAVESCKACWPEIVSLLTPHYEELALNKDKVPLNPRWDIYEVLENNGKLLFISVRTEDTNTLIGYSIGLIDYELHYKDCLGYQMDILYINPEYRDGNIGNKLMAFLEEALRERKVRRVVMRSKLHKDIGLLFKRHKFKEVEMCYSKWIGE